MAKVTSKLQVTIPKALAERRGIAPGDEIDWDVAGDSLRLVPRGTAPGRLEISDRLALFDLATERQRHREAARPTETGQARGWSRDELYDRGGAR